MKFPGLSTQQSADLLQIQTFGHADQNILMFFFISLIPVVRLRRAQHHGEAAIKDLRQQGDEDTDAWLGRCRQD